MPSCIMTRSLQLSDIAGKCICTISAFLGLSSFHVCVKKGVSENM